MSVVEIAAGISVDAVPLGGADLDNPPDFGLYCDKRWTVPWHHEHIAWEDYKLPSDFVKAADLIHELFRCAAARQRVQVGCGAGRGRTGTVLACLCVLDGRSPKKAIELIRERHSTEAIETKAQEWWVEWFASDVKAQKCTSISPEYENPRLRPNVRSDRLWCYLTSACQAVYREARHIGPLGSGSPLVTSGQFESAARKCQAAHDELESARIWADVRSARSVQAIMQPYNDVTGLSLDDMAKLFAYGDWTTGYGGEKWARVVRLTMNLAAALTSDDEAPAKTACSELLRARHNNAALVPPLREWQESPRLQQKWPCVCDCEQELSRDQGQDLPNL